jgi:hypothetical protein
MFDKTCTRKDFFKVLGAGVGSLFVANPIVGSLIPAAVTPATIVSALSTPDEVEVAITDLKDPIAQILIEMSDYELFATLKLMSNSDLSKLGTQYAWLCNRVAGLAFMYDADQANNVLQVWCRTHLEG